MKSTAPLPLAGEVDALGSAIARQSASGGGKSVLSTSAFCGSTPTPTLPREERERERTSVAVMQAAGYIPAGARSLVNDSGPLNVIEPLSMP